MPSYDERTPSGWPLPFKSNTLEVDVERLRKTLYLIDDALAKIEAGTKLILDEKVNGLEERQYILDARMDVIAGQTTEDTEILDARVDAKGTTHPNLGHNVRTLHSEVIELNENVKYGIEEFRGLLRQFNELAYAQIQSDLNSQDAHERRKQEIQLANERISEETQTRIDSDDAIHEELAQEALTRNEQDEALQTQVQELSESGIQQSLNIHAEIEQRRKDDIDIRREVAQRLGGLTDKLNEETVARIEADTKIRTALNDTAYALENETQTLKSQDKALQAQADSLSEASLNNALNISRENEKRRAEISSEETSRISSDELLQGQTDELSRASLQHSLNLHSEAEKRRKIGETLSQDLIAIKEELGHEEYLRVSNDDTQQRQIDSLTNASLQDSLNLQHEIARRKSADDDEVQARIIQGEVLQSEIDDLTTTSLRQNLNIQHEAEQRRAVKDALNSEIISRIDNDDELRESIADRAGEIISEAEIRASEDSALQAEINELSRGAIHDRLNELALNERRKQDILREAEIRTEHDEVQQRQIDSLANASLQDALNLHREAVKREEADSTERFERSEHDAGLQIQIDELAVGLARNALTAAENNNRSKYDIQQEARTRTEQNALLQRQIDEQTEQSASQQTAITNLTDASLRDAINLSEEAASRRSADKEEIQARTLQGEVLQTQIDALAQSGIRQSLNLQSETEKRREGFSQVQRELNAQRERIELQEEQSTQHKAVIDDIIEAMLRSSVNLHEALERRRDALTREAEIRSEQVQNLQTQTQELSEASIRQSLNIKREAEQRREFSSTTRRFIDIQLELNDYLNTQIADLINGAIQGAKNLHDALERRREALSREVQTRAENDAVQQSEIDRLTEASIRASLNLHEAQVRNRTSLQQETQTRSEQVKILQGENSDNALANLQQSLNLVRESEKRRELSQIVAGIKSPVDWSKSTSVQIPEPRCAVVNFTGLKSMPTSKTADIPAVIEFWDMQGNYFRKNIICSAQGNSSLAYVKKNVKVDLLNEDGSEFKLKIGSWVVQDGFHLKAYYTDFFRGVGVTSYKLWDEIMETKPFKNALIDIEGMTPTAKGSGNISDLTLQIDTGALCHPDAFPCIVYLNGEFYGVFSWQIKKQRKNYHMDKSTVEHIHLDGTLSTANFWNGTINWTAFEIRNPNKLYTMDGKKYDGDAPRELIDETSEKYDPNNKDHVRSATVKRYIQGFVQSFGVLKNLYAAYRASPGDEMFAAVKAKYEELFDWKNQRDYLIFSDIIKNSDGFAKNWQWTTYDGIKWFVNAYDLDMSFGGDWQGRYITAPLTGHINTSTALPVYYASLLYHSELEARYKKLRDTGIIDVEHIVSKLADWTARIGEGNYELEYERWPNSPCLLNYNDSVDRVRKWLAVEIANMDKVYSYTQDSGISAQDFHAEILERESEAQIRANNDEALQAQINDLSKGAIQDRFNTLALNARCHQEIQEEIQTRREENSVQDRQIHLLAHAGIRRDLNTQSANDRRKAEILQEILTRSNSDKNLQSQIDELSFAVIRIALNDYEARERIKEYLGTLYQAVADTGNLTYMGAGVASSSEVSDMLADVLSGSDAGEITGTGIPEELKDRVATSTEVSSMLAEIFHNNNNRN